MVALSDELARPAARLSNVTQRAETKNVALGRTSLVVAAGDGPGG